MPVPEHALLIALLDNVELKNVLYLFMFSRDNYSPPLLLYLSWCFPSFAQSFTEFSVSFFYRVSSSGVAVHFSRLRDTLVARCRCLVAGSGRSDAWLHGRHHWTFPKDFAIEGCWWVHMVGSKNGVWGPQPKIASLFGNTMTFPAGIFEFFKERDIKPQAYIICPQKKSNMKY